MNDIGALQKMEWAKLNSAATAAANKINPPAQRNLLVSAASERAAVEVVPTMDGRIIPVRSF